MSCDLRTYKTLQPSETVFYHVFEVSLGSFSIQLMGWCFSSQQSGFYYLGSLAILSEIMKNYQTKI